MVPDLVPETKCRGGSLGLGTSASDQFRAGTLVMPGAPIRHRDENDVMTEPPVEGRQAPGLVLGIIRMSANDQQSQRSDQVRSFLFLKSIDGGLTRLPILLPGPACFLLSG